VEYPKWPLFTLRAFAVANFIVVALGLLFLVDSVYGMRVALRNTTETPYFIASFWTMTAINVCFLSLLVLGGFYLLKPRMLGVAVCNAVFISEILYFFSIGFFFWGLPRNISMGIAAATGIGNMGLSPQLVSAYPLFALGGLNLARRAAVRALLKSKDRNVQSS
jgi:hypothetical protein